jgi:transposase-like protein
MNLVDVNRMFPTDDKCRELLTRLRWPEGVRCPRCNMAVVELETEKTLYYCKACDYQFSVTAGTVFNDSHLPLTKWFLATLLLCEAKKGMSACQIQRTIGVSYKTAWYLCHRIRASMVESQKPMLDGKVEMDETYIGGVAHGKGQGPHAGDKQVVIGIRKRGGDLRFFHTKDLKKGTLEKFIRENLSADVDVFLTDDSPLYKGLARRMGLNHKRIKHSLGIYSAEGGEVHTNTVESAFSLLKRGITGTWHKISAKHLQSYCEEMCFRFNRRKRSDLFLDTLRHMVTAPVLTFEKLTA